ncbi:MAG: tetratricopeptide repeat protein [Lentimicrobium sp.]|jgi:tetratricopeptide (TPR) repeat protein|nr:tetratricopeptide repeat protein [Lentimicrobium sp.]
MKKLTLLLTTMLIVTATFGQKRALQDAYNNLRKGYLDKAMENIESTISDPSTMNEPKTWFYRGNVYLQIHMSDNPAYKALDKDALNKAFESYQKATELDTKKEYYAEILQNMLIISEQLYNVGVTRFTADPPDYHGSFLAFENSAKVNESFGAVDTTAMFNAARAAEMDKDFSNAKLYYNKVRELNYPQPVIYSSLASICMEEGDTATAVTYLTEGRQKYPEDFNLLISETNYFLSSKQSDKAMANLEEAIVTDPENPTIHYAVGVTYAVMGKVEDAEKSYMKAAELKPDYFEANYNLGALYVNQAAMIIDSANQLPLSQVKEYDALKLQADDILRKSIPYLEIASTLDSTDKNTMLSLKEIYTRLQMYDKLKEINARLEE